MKLQNSDELSIYSTIYWFVFWSMASAASIHSNYREIILYIFCEIINSMLTRDIWICEIDSRSKKKEISEQP